VAELLAAGDREYLRRIAGEELEVDETTAEWVIEKVPDILASLDLLSGVAAAVALALRCLEYPGDVDAARSVLRGALPPALGGVALVQAARQLAATEEKIEVNRKVACWLVSRQDMDALRAALGVQESA
jgi:hypothetical protein